MVDRDIRPPEPSRTPATRSSGPARRPPVKSQFRESLAAPVPARTYRSPALPATRPGTLEMLIRYIAVILGLLLALRFVISLFKSTRTGTAVGALYGLTDWIVRPFERVLPQPPASSMVTGYFNWAAIAALAVVLIVTAILLRLARPKRR